MLSREDLARYLNSIPPIPEVLKACKKALDEGDMVKAADIAAKDMALMAYFKNIVNKPIFGFINELHDARQIFGALGIVRTRQVFQSYYTSLIVPKNWQVFNLTSNEFSNIQASFIVKWEEVLKSFNIKNKSLEAVVTLIPAAIAVCESIFKDHLETINLIKSQKSISYEELLLRFSGYNFFDIVKIIAKKWDFSDDILKLLDILNNIKGKDRSNISIQLMVNLMLLINYEISQSVAMKSGINDLFELDCDFSEEEVENFYEIMEMTNI